MSQINPDNDRPGWCPCLARWLVSGVVTLLWLTPALIAGIFCRNVSEKILRHWSRIQLRIFGIEITVRDRNVGLYPSPPYVFIHLNQTSLSESFVIHQILPPGVRVLMNIEYALLPLIGPLLWTLGGVVIVRQWPWQARRAVDKTARLLRSGLSFYLSIEGRRSPDGRLLPYKKGPAVLSIDSHAKIVPIVLHGAREVLPHGEWRIKPGRIEAVLCETVSTDGLTYENREALTSRLREIAEKELS